MKNNLIKFYSVAIYLFSTLVMFAEGPGDDAEGAGLDSGGDNTGMPIGQYAWILAIAIIVFTFYIYKAIQKEKNS